MCIFQNTFIRSEHSSETLLFNNIFDSNAILFLIRGMVWNEYSIQTYHHHTTTARYVDLEKDPDAPIRTSGTVEPSLVSDLT